MNKFSSNIAEIIIEIHGIKSKENDLLSAVGHIQIRGGFSDLQLLEVFIQNVHQIHLEILLQISANNLIDS